MLPTIAAAVQESPAVTKNAAESLLQAGRSSISGTRAVAQPSAKSTETVVADSGSRLVS